MRLHIRNAGTIWLESRHLCLSSPIRRPLAEREIEDQERYKEEVSTPLQEDWLLSTSSFSSSDSSYTITFGIEVELSFSLYLVKMNRTSRKIDHSWVWAQHFFNLLRYPVSNSKVWTRKCSLNQKRSLGPMQWMVVGLVVPGTAFWYGYWPSS